MPMLFDTVAAVSKKAHPMQGEPFKLFHKVGLLSFNLFFDPHNDFVENREDQCADGVDP